MRLDEKDETGILKRQVIVDRLIKAAMDGDVAALRYIFDRMDGKPTEKIEQVRNTISNETREKLNNIFSES
jgi:ferritin-like protein